MSLEVDKLRIPLLRWVMEHPGNRVVGVVLEGGFIGIHCREEVLQTLWLPLIKPILHKFHPSLCSFFCQFDPLHRFPFFKPVCGEDMSDCGVRDFVLYFIDQGFVHDFWVMAH